MIYCTMEKFQEVRKVILHLFLIFTFFSCSKGSDTSSFPLDGAYDGTYLRSGDLKDTATVTIVFAGSGFSGQSSSVVRTICNGTYQVFSDSVNFINGCAIPDSSLLLVGKYKLTGTGDSLYLSKDSSMGNLHYEDQFSLKHRQ
jgi:hypothetical protein